MTKKRARQSTRRAKKLEIPRIEAAILNALGRDLARFFEEQRDQTLLDLIDQAAAPFDAGWVLPPFAAGHVLVSLKKQNTRP
jgi:hypothetical protein